MPPAIVIIGLGNRLRGDDALGPELIRRILPQLPPTARALTCAGDALSLLAAWEHAAAAIVVDAAAAGAPPGTVHRFEPRVGQALQHRMRTSTHGPGLEQALALGARLRALPKRIVCIAVEGRDFGHGEPLSAPVQAALEALPGRIAAEIDALAAATD